MRALTGLVLLWLLLPAPMEAAPAAPRLAALTLQPADLSPGWTPEERLVEPARPGGPVRALTVGYQSPWPEAGALVVTLAWYGAAATERRDAPARARMVAPGLESSVPCGRPWPVPRLGDATSDCRTFGYRPDWQLLTWRGPFLLHLDLSYRRFVAPGAFLVRLDRRILARIDQALPRR